MTLTKWESYQDLLNDKYAIIEVTLYKTVKCHRDHKIKENYPGRGMDMWR